MEKNIRFLMRIFCVKLGSKWTNESAAKPTNQRVPYHPDLLTY